MERRRVAIIGGKRIPFVKSFTHYAHETNQSMMTHVLGALVDAYGLKGRVLGDVACGAVMKRITDFNLARESVLGSGLDPHTPAVDIQRACGTSLEAAIHIANKIALGQIDVGIAGGTDTNSDIPVAFNSRLGKRILQTAKVFKGMEKLKAWKGFHPKELKPEFPSVVEPRTGLSMGEHCERMARQWKISREEQDRLTLESHQKGAQAYAAGFYEDLVVPFAGVERDGTLRKETSLEKLAKLKPVFDTSGKGTLTAGNSTPLTDGASAVLFASEAYAREHELPVLAYFRDAQVAGVDFVGGEGLLMAPAYAVSALLERNGLNLQSFDYYEIHEAFAAQVLCTLRAWESDSFCKEKLGRTEAMGEIDRDRMNVNGGSVALGHPFAATGGRIVAGLAKTLSTKPAARGLISICTAGGMGVAAILES